MLMFDRVWSIDLLTRHVISLIADFESLSIVDSIRWMVYDFLIWLSIFNFLNFFILGIFSRHFVIFYFFKTFFDVKFFHDFFLFLGFFQYFICFLGIFSVTPLVCRPIMTWWSRWCLWRQWIFYMSYVNARCMMKMQFLFEQGWLCVFFILKCTNRIKGVKHFKDRSSICSQKTLDHPTNTQCNQDLWMEVRKNSPSILETLIFFCLCVCNWIYFD